MRPTRTTSLLVLVGLTLPACSVVGRTPPSTPGVVRPGWSQEGVASWYGEPFHGRQTASGQVYDMEAATAAHRTLPFGTRLRVQNLDNGRTATVTVNDRGPFVRGRIVDVSHRIARELGMIGAGTARVRITVLDAPDPRSSGCWMVQVGAFREEGNARTMRDRLADEGFEVRLVRSPDGLRLVQAGPFSNRDTADRIADRYEGFSFRCTP